LNQRDEEEEDEVEDVVADEQLEFLRLELRKKEEGRSWYPDKKKKLRKKLSNWHGLGRTGTVAERGVFPFSVYGVMKVSFCNFV
jgi:hypothetical protein